ncbi:MarR family winged helix-turn-helix transcriptional regulator [Echinicola marina]|uniref:MarR family winged helix-turn-helix transcriptional regulator n=1 Tax=Echinicola marina TaxID=2859768 RepID=UPI001CF6B108|nr:MarR family winged helix-turn-helix transcriptional regulator [Echinicola marina]UCS94582.1 MarR family winged helix-turn-helix transcriptional regulator [Echinicola marina]
MKPEETVDFYIKTAWHAISRMYNQKGAEEGLTTSIGFVLININANEGTPATKIAPLMGLESRSLTRMLKSMEERGLIYRKPDPIDKRSVRIFLTPEGRRKKEISIDTIQEFNRSIRNVISEKDLEDFFRVFQKINQVIEEQQSEMISPNNI